MSYTGLLISTCTVRRYTEGPIDDYGHPTEVWADHLADEPCRLSASSGREITIGAEVVIADYKLFLGDVDITEQDRVVLDAVTYQVLLVTNRQNGTADHHKEVYLQVVR